VCKRRVLLCDDEPNYRFLLRAVLEPEGVEIVGEAGDGKACLEALEEADPDLILLDVRMPGMDGIQALPEIHARAPKAQIVMLSSADPADLEERTLALGATAFVRKPHDIFQVPAALRAAFA
jgi:two-component system, NarL family, nitrate/nitrite response regulator NarL